MCRSVSRMLSALSRHPGIPWFYASGYPQKDAETILNYFLDNDERALLRSAHVRMDDSTKILSGFQKGKHQQRTTQTLRLYDTWRNSDSGRKGLCRWASPREGLLQGLRKAAKKVEKKVFVNRQGRLLSGCMQQELTRRPSKTVQGYLFD